MGRNHGEKVFDDTPSWLNIIRTGNADWRRLGYWWSRSQGDAGSWMIIVTTVKEARDAILNLLRKGKIHYVRDITMDSTIR